MAGRKDDGVEGAVPPTPGLRLLLVHDPPEPELTRTLARQGHDVLAVRAGERPARFLEVFSPDVIVVATREGADMCHDLRLAGPFVAIIAIVAGRDAEDRITLLDAGADDCPATPFSPEELEARIATASRRVTPATARARAQGPRQVAGAQ